MQWVMNKQGQLLVIDSRPFPPLLKGQYCTQTYVTFKDFLCIVKIVALNFVKKSA